MGGRGGGGGRLDTHDESLELRGPFGANAAQRAGEGRVGVAAICIFVLYSGRQHMS